MKAPARLLIVFATRAEALPLIDALGLAAVAGGADAWCARDDAQAASPIVALCGMGPAAAAVGTARQLAAWRPDWVVNAGIAGALAARYALGEVISVDAVAASDAPEVCADAFTPHGALALPWPARGGTGARLVTRSLPVFDPALRESLGRTADLVDMEGAVVARQCAAAGIPCGLLKAVSDFADDRATLHRNLALASTRLAERLADHPLTDGSRGVPA